MIWRFPDRKMRKIFSIWKFKFLAVPTAILAVLLVLLVFVLKFGISKITVLKASLREAQKKESILRQKQDFLTRLDSGVLSQTNSVVAALPDTNSSLSALYQIKTLALNTAVNPTNFKVGAETKEKSSLSKVDITFEVEGEIGNLVSFLSSLKTIAPLLTINRIDLSLADSRALATVRVSSYWSEFPTELPPLTEPLREMTSDESETLAQVLLLTPPPFVQLSASAPVEREDPFK